MSRIEILFRLSTDFSCKRALSEWNASIPTKRQLEQIVHTIRRQQRKWNRLLTWKTGKERSFDYTPATCYAQKKLLVQWHDSREMSRVRLPDRPVLSWKMMSGEFPHLGLRRRKDKSDRITSNPWSHSDKKLLHYKLFNVF